jgi:hypothetical protein
MAFRLFIGADEVPVASDAFRPTLAGPDLTAWGEYPSAYSNELSIPYTAAVAAVFGLAAHPLTVTTLPYDVPAPAVATINGVEMLQGAVLSLTGYESGSLQGNLFQGALSLFETLADKSLRDLATLGVVPWTLAELAANGFAPATPDQNWRATIEYRGRPIPIYDAGNPESVYSSRLVYPTSLVQYVFEAVIAEAGWASAGWLSAELAGLVMPLHTGYPRRSPAQIAALTGSLSMSTFTVSASEIWYVHVGLPALGTVTITAVVDYVTAGDYSPNYPFILLDVYATGPAVGQSVRLKQDSAGRATLSVTVSTGEETDLSAWVIRILFAHEHNGGTGPARSIDCAFISLTYAYTEDLWPGEDYNLAANLPDISQADFLKGIFNFFALLPTFDAVTKTLRLIELRDAVAQEPQDWSALIAAPVVSNHPDSVTWKIGDYAQSNALAWIVDDAEPVPVGGGGALTIPDVNLPATGELFTLPWAASGPFDTGQFTTLSIPTQVPNEDGEYTFRDVEPRLGDLGGDEVIVNLDDFLAPGAGPTATSLYFTKCVGTIDLADRATTYYAPLQAMLTRPYVATHAVRLDAAALATVDFTRPVYIAAFGHSFWLNALPDADADGLTTATLIRLN